ncbi:hypothetical protein CDAR_458201 [Caerostris darwini]|uniref:Uncharacterized protein n=1 Tax=Caerostris darwini TaxID=1538125 RepID=A0AAV4WUX5_9ARAC|nr:hypothetical protein CDAR_458201 [Caerostris darwini]
MERQQIRRQICNRLHSKTLILQWLLLRNHTKLSIKARLSRVFQHRHKKTPHKNFPIYKLNILWRGWVFRSIRWLTSNHFPPRGNAPTIEGGSRHIIEYPIYIFPHNAQSGMKACNFSG